MSWETSFLVRSEILGLFVYIFITDDKFSRRKMGKFPQLIPMQLSKKLGHFQTNMTIIAQVFPKLMTPKDVVT